MKLAWIQCWLFCEGWWLSNPALHEGLNKIAFVCTGMHFFALTVPIDSCGTAKDPSAWLRRSRSILLQSSWRPWRLVRPSVFLSGRSPRGSPPPLSLRTGLVSHFLRVLTECREAGELGAELLDACGWIEATEAEMLPSLPATEYGSARRKQRQWVHHHKSKAPKQNMQVNGT